MAWGGSLKRGDKGADVIELQMRLAGFRGTLPDGDYGPGTELQVSSFQRDVMGQTKPTGQADAATIAAIAAFGAAHPVDFQQLACRCGVCGGFGRGLFKGKYRGTVKAEAYNRYEYPGIHRMILWAYRAAMFYAGPKGWTLTINSGYRCSEDNRQHGRSSTNHHGKAIDMDILGAPSKMIDRERCNTLRGLLVEKANAQIGWSAANRKSLEPAEIAPTWVHYDVRSYDSRYLADRYFVKTAAALDTAPMV
ncbi:MAG: peptidoglycan-binding protein [Caulobacter sp.]|nr:peptidoglycan-binding protein [Caulobacter sp.]